LTLQRRDTTIAGVRRGLARIGRGFLFGFSAAVGAWVALVVLGILVMLVLRPWG
jgi:hypothetical protein